MSLFFLYNNLHFSFEILGALAFFVVAWLAFDVFPIRRDFLTASRGIGFLFLAVWQVIHALNPSVETTLYLGASFYILGAFFVLLNLLLERPVERPEFKAIFVFPAFAAASVFLEAGVAFLYLATAYFAFAQYKKELKKMLKPFFTSFIFLGLGAAVSLFYPEDSLGALWVLGHIFELLGFGFLIAWVWQYLELRIREELLLISTSVALLIAIMVTLVFSVILVGQIERATRADLETNARVLNLAVERLKEEALAKAKLLSQSDDLKRAVLKRDFAALEEFASGSLTEEKLGFLTILEENGDVLLRAHALTQKDDNLSGERAVREALAGRFLVNIESSPTERFSIRAAAPLTDKGKVIGVVVTGFLLDNAFVDNLKRITGLDALIFERDIVVASTLISPDGRTRVSGIKEVRDDVLRLLEYGRQLTISTEIVSRPYLISYFSVLDSDGRVVGMLASAKPQREILDLANATNRLTLITVAVIMLILSVPIYIATRRLTSEVK